MTKKPLQILLAFSAVLFSGRAAPWLFAFDAPKQQGADFRIAILQDQGLEEQSEYPKISTHENFRADGDMERFLWAMSVMGIQTAVFTPAGDPPGNRGYKKHMRALLKLQRKYPRRIIAYAAVDERSRKAPKILEKAFKKGAQGLKLSGAGGGDSSRAAGASIVPGLRPGASETLSRGAVPAGAGDSGTWGTRGAVPIDSEKMYKIYRVCRKWKRPILMRLNPRKIPGLRAGLERVLKDFPDVTFIGARYAGYAPELDKCAKLLDKYPNFFIDISLGRGIARHIEYIHAEAEKFREFIVRYQDRIMWGTDIVLNKRITEFQILRRTAADFNCLQREFHITRYAKSMAPKRGLNLPPQVLSKIYFWNPIRILRLETR